MDDPQREWCHKVDVCGIVVTKWIKLTALSMLLEDRKVCPSRGLLSDFFRLATGDTV